MKLQGKRDCAAACAQIKDRGSLLLKRQLDKQLGFRPGDQDRRIDGEIEPVKLLSTQEIGNRDARLPSMGQIEVSVFDLEGDVLLGRGRQGRLGKAANLGKKKTRLARIDARARNRL